MRRTRSHPFAFLGFFLAALAASPEVAPTLPDLFQKAKEQVKLGSYDTALATLQQIDSASRQAGLERDRDALQPSLAFYRGVCLAALGKDADAREQFAAYLERNPQTRLDPAIYPKRAIAVFEEAQKAAAHPPDASEANSAGIAPAYRAFRRPELPPYAAAGDDWADGPARFLLTASEADEFRRLTDPIARAEFIARFWKARDPKPETPENEFRDEFERRVAFADRFFSQGETRGSATDRGTVFVLLGPPAHSVVRPMKTGEDTGDPIGVYLYTPGQVAIAKKTSTELRVEMMTGPGTSSDQPENWREVWRYYRKELPARLPYAYVDFDFISRPGYGVGVLQRDPAALDALDRAKASLPRP